MARVTLGRRRDRSDGGNTVFSPRGAVDIAWQHASLVQPPPWSAWATPPPARPDCPLRRPTAPPRDNVVRVMPPSRGGTHELVAGRVIKCADTGFDA